MAKYGKCNNEIKEYVASNDTKKGYLKRNREGEGYVNLTMQRVFYL